MRSLLHRCERMARRLSSEDRQCLANGLHPSITVSLNEDVIFVICQYLEADDRISFLCALLRVQPRHSWPRLCMYPSLRPLLIREYASRTLASRVQRMAERLHYMLPQAQARFGMVLCNWSPFSTQMCAPVAVVYWSTSYPHARVDVHSSLRTNVRRSLLKMQPVVRLTAHLTTCAGGTVVKAHKCRQRIVTTPCLWQQVDLLTDVGLDVSCLYDKTVRHILACA